MKLQNQVCSLESAKKLKKMGFKQESLWYWIKDGYYRKDGYPHYNWKLETEEHWNVADAEWGMCRELKKDKDIEFLSAYTVAELGEMLRNAYKKMKGKILYTSSARINQLNKRVHETLEREAESRAKILIYLKENKLLK